MATFQPSSRQQLENLGDGYISDAWSWLTGSAASGAQAAQSAVTTAATAAAIKAAAVARSDAATLSDIETSTKAAVKAAIGEQTYDTLAATLGVGAAPSVYLSMPKSMYEVPKDIFVAYDNAITWLSIGISRAIYDQNLGAEKTLTVARDTLSGERALVSAQAGWVCKATGYLCPKGDRASVYKEALDAVEASTLSKTDVDKIGGALRLPLWTLYFYKALPAIGLVGGAAFGVVVYRRWKK